MSERASLRADGYDTTVVLDCGDEVRLCAIPGLPDPKVGEWRSCSRHSAVLAYDQRDGDPIWKRDRRVTEVRREL